MPKNKKVKLESIAVEEIKPTEEVKTVAEEKPVLEIPEEIKIDSSALPDIIKSFTAEEVQQYEFAKGFCKDKNVVELNNGYSLGLVRKELLGDVKSIVAYSQDRPKISEMKKGIGSKELCQYSDMETLECGDGVADVVLVFDILQYVKNPVQLLAEIKRILSPSGTVIISASNYQGMNFVDKRHLKEYTSTQLIEMIGKKFRNLKYYKQKPIPITEVQDGWYDGQIILMVASNVL
ncbi:MAG: methyltransferase domain-containing protein [Candidatus Woesebacteria bacterium]|nr:methyltransferase domain-containing protein [Candidatus Woesebacteria bacterium]